MVSLSLMEGGEICAVVLDRRGIGLRRQQLMAVLEHSALVDGANVYGQDHNSVVPTTA